MITNLDEHLREGVKNPEWAARMLQKHLEEIKENPGDEANKDITVMFIHIVADEYDLKGLS